MKALVSYLDTDWAPKPGGSVVMVDVSGGGVNVCVLRVGDWDDAGAKDDVGARGGVEVICLHPTPQLPFPPSPPLSSTGIYLGTYGVLSFTVTLKESEVRSSEDVVPWTVTVGKERFHGEGVLVSIVPSEPLSRVELKG